MSEDIKTIYEYLKEFDVETEKRKRFSNALKRELLKETNIDIKYKNQNYRIDKFDLIYPYKNLKEVFLFIKDLYNISEKINIEKPQYIKMPEWLFRWFVTDGHFIYKINFKKNDYYMIGCKIIVSYNIKELQEIEVY